MLNPSLVNGYCNTFIKKLDEASVTFRIKTLNFTRFIRLNWLVDITLRGPGLPRQYYCLGAHLNWGYLNIIVGGIFKLVGKMKLKGPGVSGSILLLGAHLNRGPFKYYCRGHF